MSWKDKKAVVQLREEDIPSGVPRQNGISFNVWYNKWSQGTGRQERYVSPYRLDVSDSGVTEGDRNGTQKFCLYFAKGMCSLGHKCAYLHHVPAEEDQLRYATSGNQMLDCFGREKFGEYREDMGGVGSFHTVNKTLYVGGITGALRGEDGVTPRKIESRIRYLFGQLGALDRVRYVEAKNCAFVRYKAQINAEFAKEAMSNQPLTKASTDTGVLVKWAHEDPDPESQRLREQEKLDESISAMVHLLSTTSGPTNSGPLKKSAPTTSISHALLQSHPHTTRRLVRTTTQALSHQNVLALYDSE